MRRAFSVAAIMIILFFSCLLLARKLPEPTTASAISSSYLKQTPAPTPEPTPAPTPEPTPEPTPRWQGSFDSGVLFIGDSLTFHLITLYLQPNGYMGGASCMAVASSGLPHFALRGWTMDESSRNAYGVACNEEFRGLTFAEAVEKSAGLYDTVYFLMGSNGSDKVSVDAYVEVVDRLVAAYPDAVIYMQTVPPCRTGRVGDEHVNECVAGTVARYEDGGNDNVRLLDTNSVWSFDHTLKDGVHLTEEGLKVWFDYIVEQTQS